MLQIFRVSGSWRVTRAGSVLAASLLPISSAVSRRPIVLPMLLDILPGRPARDPLASARIGLGFGEEIDAAAELGVPLTGDLTRQLQVLDLVISYRNEVGAIEQDISCHEHRVIQETRRHTLESLRLIFELRHPLELA